MNNLKVKTACLILLLSPGIPLAVADEVETPSIELLEFLGDWQTPEGDYFDPLILAEDSRDQPKTEATDDN